MSPIRFALEPPEHWDDRCAEHNDLFNSTPWQRVLSQGFGSTTLYGSQPDGTPQLTITVFGAGPFRIGYLGFPLGEGVGAFKLSPETVLTWKTQPFPVAVHGLRLPVSAFSPAVELPLPVRCVPETAIEDLQNWQPQRFEKLRRVINKARRSSLKIIAASDPAQGQALFRLYRDTVRRHGGSLRYPAPYFGALIGAAQTHTNLRCLLALTPEAELAGFLVLARHGDMACYLHGGIDPRLKHGYPSDLLFYHAIAWAQREGLCRFNMMASPADQASLVRYKEKWGGVTAQHKTYELSRQPVLTLAFKGAAWAQRRLGGLFGPGHG